jgi:hypothetical protein
LNIELMSCLFDEIIQNFNGVNGFLTQNEVSLREKEGILLKSIVSEEECAMIAEELGVEKVLPEWLGANLFLKGFPELTTLPMGSRILFPSQAGLICR